METKLTELLVKYLPTIKGLFIGCALLLFAFVGLNSILTDFTESKTVKWIIFIIIQILWIITWYGLNYYYPKKSNKLIRIAFCIQCENSKQEARLYTDLINEISNKFYNTELCERVDLYTFSKIKVYHLSKILNAKTLKAPNSSQSKKLTKILKTMGIQFLVFGDIKVRSDGDSKYVLNLHALATHTILDPINEKLFKNDLSSFWPKPKSFEEKFELTEFKLTANSIYLAVSFIIGVIALISRDVFSAIAFHKTVYDELIKPNGDHDNYLLKQRVNLLLATEYNIAATINYRQKEYSIAEKYNKCSLNHKEFYNNLLLASILTFLLYEDVVKSQALLLKSSNYANSDKLWIINRAFLFIVNKEYETGFSTYQKVVREKANYSEELIKEVIQFIEDFLRIHNDRIEFYFIIGFLYYKLVYNLPLGLEYFEKYVESPQFSQIKFFQIKTREYIKDIKTNMRLRLN